MEHGAISEWNDDATSQRSPIIVPTVNTDRTYPSARSILSVQVALTTPGIHRPFTTKAPRAPWTLLVRLTPCQGGANTGEQVILTGWLAQIANHTVTQGLLPIGIVRGSRDQDRWDVPT